MSVFPANSTAVAAAAAVARFWTSESVHRRNKGLFVCLFILEKGGKKKGERKREGRT